VGCNAFESHHLARRGMAGAVARMITQTATQTARPRQGIHLQVPVLFDYFHLSAVLTTIHCSLLTLLPPVMLGFALLFINTRFECIQKRNDLNV